MDTHIRNIIIGGAMAALICAGCEGFAPSKKTSAPPPAPSSVSAPSQPYEAKTSKKEKEFISHKIMAGETMGSIAKWYSGEVEDWVKIAEANPEVEPTELHIGDKLKIPASMATAHKEQPDFSTAGLISKTKKASQGAAETPLSPAAGGAAPATGSTPTPGSTAGAAPATSGSCPVPGTPAPPQPSTAEPCFGPR